MRIQLVPLLFLATIVYGNSTLAGGDAARPMSFDQALHAAAENSQQALSMQIECTSEEGIRSLNLFPGGVAIWNNRVQVTIDNPSRTRLIKALQKADFASFDTHYGGKPGSGRIKAPNIVMCSVEVQTGGVEKASYQDVNGDRFENLLKLAADLLDIIEPLGEQGVVATSLADALNLLKQGKLAPQVLVLRVLHLYADTDKAGAMLRIEAGELSRRVYHPGVTVGDWESSPIDAETFQGVIQQLLDTKTWSLPANLPSTDSYQMSVSVLNHSNLIRSRPLNNKTVQQKTEQGVAFTAMADWFLSLKP